MQQTKENDTCSRSGRYSASACRLRRAHSEKGTNTLDRGFTGELFCRSKRGGESVAWLKTLVAIMDVSQDALVDDRRERPCLRPSIRTSRGGGGMRAGPQRSVPHRIAEQRKSCRGQGALAASLARVDGWPITQPCLAADRHLMHKPD